MSNPRKSRYGVLAALGLATLSACTTPPVKPEEFAPTTACAPARRASETLAAAIDTIPQGASIFIADANHQDIKTRCALSSENVIAALARRGIKDLALEFTPTLQEEANKLWADPSYRPEFLHKAALGIILYWVRDPAERRANFTLMADVIQSAARHNINIHFIDSADRNIGPSPLDIQALSRSPTTAKISNQAEELFTRRFNEISPSLPAPLDFDSVLEIRARAEAILVESFEKVLAGIPQSELSAYAAGLKEAENAFGLNRIDDRDRIQLLKAIRQQSGRPIAVIFGTMHADDRIVTSLYYGARAAFAPVYRIGTQSMVSPQSRVLYDIAQQFDVNADIATGQISFPARQQWPVSTPPRSGRLVTSAKP